MPTKKTHNIRSKLNHSLGKRSLGRREWGFVALGWFIVSMMLIAVDQTGEFLAREKMLKYREGDTAEADFILDKDFTFIDRELTAKAINLNRSLVPPVYEIRSEITDAVLGRFDRFIGGMKSAFADENGRDESSLFRGEFPGAAGLLDGVSSRNPEEILENLEITRDVLETLQFAGIFHLDSLDGGTASGVIEVMYSGNMPEHRVTLIRNAVATVEGLPERLRKLDRLGNLPEEDVEFITALVTFFAEPNGYLNRRYTEKNRENAEKATEAVTVSLASGTRLLTAGKVVTLRQARILDALGETQTIGFYRFLDPFLLMAIIIALGIVGTRNYGVTFRNPKSFWLYISLWGIYILTAALFIEFLSFQGGITISVIMPTALFTLLLAQLLQHRRMAILSSFLMALYIFFLTGGNSHDFLVTLASGIAGVLAVKQRETRMGLVRAGPRLALMMSVFTFLSGILVRLPMREALLMAAGSAANGLITGVLSLAFLPLLEHLLNTATTFRLIELSDQNVPVLKRMRLQAPGTYIHSQNVAHLAEAACDAIGANGLLARVGAYYHDIGKVDQAHLFVENQNGENKHDDLKASLSVAVIKSHVKIGIEKGRELRLPEEVLAVIEQHHGTSVIKYFYDRASKEKNGEFINPEDFSYGGPKPHSREAAVVMLADSAEAAGRTLKKPTVAKLEKYVWDLIMERFKMGELNESNLTLRDLETVKEAFVQVLTGHFHSRIEYPNELGISK